ncbi:hypothetical protein PPYR_05936 [Photinus pyralis]|uniref:Aminopeptidase n=1 Tax=Photinus pyralis TaxID=7054 RepID=A0A1Y1MA14_PHOPY|nr:aminopeptidase N [Photinus pyralis]KAB0800196.1 hypothetical protein PPYR_05936 [Photinus pyralis]
MAAKALTVTLFLLCLVRISLEHSLLKRSIDLIASHSLIVDSRLPREIAPNSYTIELHPFPEEGYFKGKVKINLTWHEPANKITLHAHEDLVIEHSEVKVTQIVPDDERLRSLTAPFEPTDVKVTRSEVVPKKPLYVIHLDKQLKTGAQCTVDITYSGKLYNDTSGGLFRTNYINTHTGRKEWLVASQLRPNLARKVFPCFDEPAFKATFLVSIVRSNLVKSLSNMPLSKSEELHNCELVRDYFEESPPMSTFTFGVLLANFVSITVNKTDGQSNPDTEINVWATPDFIGAVQNATEKIYTSLKALEKLWDFKFPLPKLDCVALPNYQGTRPADNWGLIFFKESELSSKGSWLITHELVYQWLGALATPFWWSDAHINNALARYITSYITLQVSDGKETFHNWPMTMLYSIYYEFSKRYPHGKVMAIKQDSSSTKTEMIFRMLNYTLGETTFNNGLKRFMADRQYRTFFGDDVWSSITEQARIDGKLDESISANEIAGSWISRDRLPVLNIQRSTNGTSATITQRVYLRERPHDVPDQDKLLWWIPIVLVTQDKLNFTNTFPVMWMKREREVSLSDLPSVDKFIIVNPEEIGPFPVNYDVANWDLLSKYLQTGERNNIPVNTRAKLLHDAWNLAYAGELSFSTALDMTLFLKYEREYIAWDPIFTMIDHIGRHIDGSNVHKKFLMYVRMLLTPLYEELGTEAQEGENEGRANLRSSAKVFLCQAGYKPCIEEAQHAFDKWMEAENPDEGNPVANQYICPVFKWGSKEEWEFGLQRVINFPPSRKQSERTYLLKTLAGCPIDSWKIEKILNITILEKNGNFTDNDIYLIFSMLTGSSSGYTTLFNYLTKNWNGLKNAFENKPQLWNSLITSSTSVFKTQEGLDMVTKLYKEKQNDLGTADFVITKAIKNIKEEAKWSNDNLPVIESWLQKYLNLEKNGSGDEGSKFL